MSQIGNFWINFQKSKKSNNSIFDSLSDMENNLIEEITTKKDNYIKSVNLAFEKDLKFIKNNFKKLQKFQSEIEDGEGENKTTFKQKIYSRKIDLKSLLFDLNEVKNDPLEKVKILFNISLPSESKSRTALSSLLKTKESSIQTKFTEKKNHLLEIFENYFAKDPQAYLHQDFQDKQCEKYEGILDQMGELDQSLVQFGELLKNTLLKSSLGDFDSEQLRQVRQEFELETLFNSLRGLVLDGRLPADEISEGFEEKSISIHYRPKYEDSDMDLLEDLNPKDIVRDIQRIGSNMITPRKIEKQPPSSTKQKTLPKSNQDILQTGTNSSEGQEIFNLLEEFTPLKSVKVGIETNPFKLGEVLTPNLSLNQPQLKKVIHQEGEKPIEQEQNNLESQSSINFSNLYLYSESHPSMIQKVDQTPPPVQEQSRMMQFSRRTTEQGHSTTSRNSQSRNILPLSNNGVEMGQQFGRKSSCSRNKENKKPRSSTLQISNSRLKKGASSQKKIKKIWPKFKLSKKAIHLLKKIEEAKYWKKYEGKVDNLVLFPKKSYQTCIKENPKLRSGTNLKSFPQPIFTLIDFSNCMITDEMLAFTRKRNTSLIFQLKDGKVQQSHVSILLPDNMLTSLGLEGLLVMIKRARIGKIDLRSNKINSQGLEQLVSYMKGPKTFEVISQGVLLENNPITPQKYLKIVPEDLRGRILLQGDFVFREDRDRRRLNQNQQNKSRSGSLYQKAWC